MNSREITEPKFTVRETAQLLRRSEETIRRYLRTNSAFPRAYRFRKGWLIPQSDLRQYLKKMRRSATMHDVVL